MNKTLKEFRDFIATGNLLDIAIAFVLGVAVQQVIKTFIDGIVMNTIAIFFGKPDFNDVVITVNSSKILVGSFITAVINLVIVGAVLFAMVKVLSKIRKSPDVAPTEIELLTEIRDSLQK